MLEFGINIDDLSQELNDFINQYLAIKQHTGLKDLSDISLRQWYILNKTEVTDLQAVAGTLKLDLNKRIRTNSKVEDEIRDLKRLFCFIENIFFIN